MAEEKKPTGILESHDPYEVIAFLLLLMIVGGYFLERFLNFRHSGMGFLEWIKAYLVGIIPFVIVISATLSVLLLIGIIRSNMQLKKLHHELQIKFHSVHSEHDDHVVSEERVNKRWQKVQGLIMSQNINDWKLAILEADVMLDEMINQIGYRGESLGEKLKNVEKSDFTTVDLAWEAHKIRNTIAHEGTNFMITHREALRVIGLFEKVFHEFQYI